MAFIAYFWMLSEISVRARVLVEGRNGFTGEIEGPSFLSGAQQASVEEARENAGSHKRTLPIRQNSGRGTMSKNTPRKNCGNFELWKFKFST
jgi:hypothetical protein